MAARCFCCRSVLAPIKARRSCCWSPLTVKLVRRLSAAESFSSIGDSGCGVDLASSTSKVSVSDPGLLLQNADETLLELFLPSTNLPNIPISWLLTEVCAQKYSLLASCKILLLIFLNISQDFSKFWLVFR